ncbi:MULTISPECIES: arpA protein [unclassified Amycolatopsis]|uniref:HalD/BesD family halogenase n=1 Tax=unclassified Amycolatopsis TaxID=2618356 RepID=UPI002876FF89|nr:MULTISPECIES: arpA protein [unclassified Amycolatopsis]MDS0135537.1 arpA protein [Amycolatopsis sp. 505]MDS0140772.1 arpA protein [Amycolatopsis sp. CM201R]
MSTSVAPLEMVDTDRYPLTEPDSPAWREVVGRTRAELADAGCSVLPDFIRAELHDVLRAECAALEPHAYTKIEKVNAYNTAIDEPLPEDHPGRTIMERGNAFVARDRIPASAIISRLYTSPVFRRFVADCFGLPELHELADPLSGLTLNVIAPGRAHPWHFDTNTHTVSMLTQAADAGGIFEYCPNIRSAADENFAAVRSVLAGDTRLVRRLNLRPGDLQLFKGRFALHRVSTVEGAIARHSAIFAYSERPGVIGSVERTRQLFGRVLPAHLAERTARGDELLD